MAKSNSKKYRKKLAKAIAEKFNLTEKRAIITIHDMDSINTKYIGTVFGRIFNLNPFQVTNFLDDFIKLRKHLKKIAKAIAKKFNLNKKESRNTIKQIPKLRSMSIGNSMAIGNVYAETFGINRWKVRSLVQDYKEKKSID